MIMVMAKLKDICIDNNAGCPSISVGEVYFNLVIKYSCLIFKFSDHRLPSVIGEGYNFINQAAVR
jgi:hypothetical protein